MIDVGQLVTGPGQVLLQSCIINPSSSFCTTGNSVIPLVFLALLIDAILIALWYMAGAILNNSGVRNSARGELEQFAGTAIILFIILTILFAFGGVFNSAYNTPSDLMSVSSIQSLCSQVKSTSGNGFFFVGTQSAYMCSIVQQAQSGDPSALIEYPLAASGVVLANLTNQLATAMNDTFIVDAWIAFESKIALTAAVCINLPPIEFPAPTPCNLAGFLPPIPFPLSPTVYVKIWGQPASGLEFITRSFGTLSNLLYVSLGSFIVQLEFINMLLYSWPFLIFIGALLRSTPFTRKAGGALIAIAIGALLIYPTIFTLEYLGANNTNIAPNVQLNFCGGNPLDNYGASTYTYNLNFFVPPDLQRIARSCGCWPYLGLSGTELMQIGIVSGYQYWGSDIFNSVLTGITNMLSDLLNAASDLANGKTAQAVSDIFSGLVSIILSVFALPSAETFTHSILGCAPGSVNEVGGAVVNSGAEGTVFGFIQAYAVYAITAYFLPIVNIIITIAAILGLSGLMGGDVNLAGLSRFV